VCLMGSGSIIGDAALRGDPALRLCRRFAPPFGQPAAGYLLSVGCPATVNPRQNRAADTPPLFFKTARASAPGSHNV